MSKRRIALFCVIALLGAGLGFAQGGGAETVYVSSPDKGKISEVAVNGGGYSVLVTSPPAGWEDLVYGPDGLVYAFDEGRDRIYRFDPASPSVLEEVYVYSKKSGADLQSPHSGWFTNRGDLLVTSSSGVWIFEGLTTAESTVTPTKLQCGGADCPSFDGGGLVQAANGDLLVVDRADGSVWKYTLQPYATGLVFSGSGEIISGLTDPVGIARASTGEIYVATGDYFLWKFASDGTDGAICEDFSETSDRPYYLEMSADDTIYLATTNSTSGALWETTDCSLPDDPIVRFTKTTTGMASMVGVAVPPTAVVISKSGGNNDGELAFNFGDMAYLLTAGAGCAATVTAEEVLPEDIDQLIEIIRLQNYDPNDPVDELVNAAPVIFLGDDGRAQLFDVPVPENTDGTCDPVGGLYKHGISAYTELLENPRIGVCTEFASLPEGYESCPGGADPQNGLCCKVIELREYFPFNGFIPEDGFIRGATPTFSKYFMIDVDVDGTLGERCPLESPFTEVTDPDDPFIPTFSLTESVPLKFRVAEKICMGDNCTYDCDAGPFVDDARVLIAIARIDPNDPSFFEPKRVLSAGGSGEEDPAIMADPASPGQYYHYNLKFSEGYEPGIYTLVLVALTDNFPVESFYFELE